MAGMAGFEPANTGIKIQGLRPLDDIPLFLSCSSTSLIFAITAIATLVETAGFEPAPDVTLIATGSSQSLSSASKVLLLTSSSERALTARFGLNRNSYKDIPVIMDSM